MRATHASPLPRGPKRRSVGAVVGVFKSAVTRRLNDERGMMNDGCTAGTHGSSVWQRNYYEHIIRDRTALHRIRQYIIDNPAHWAEDGENPDYIYERR